MRLSSFFTSTLLLCASLSLLACASERRTPTPTDSGTSDSASDTGLDSAMPETCGNGMLDGMETSVDCGGGCSPCADGQMCTAPADCMSGVCRGRYCLVPSCTDAVRNGTETGVDCGGDCGRCAGGEPCTAGSDCLSGECVDGACTASGCEDGELNQDETGIDCGGMLCGPCAGGEACLRDEDCVSTICDVGTCTVPSCMDRTQNQDETSIDCGGMTCDPCRDGFSCLIDPDCEGMRCVSGACVSCVDMVQNAEETDVDCGGGLCAGCLDGEMCMVGTDCAGGGCEAGLCVSCVDMVQNQDETDIDCGGMACMACDTGGTCVAATDCVSGICDMGTCNAPGCGDGVLNGLETDLDCGGGSCLGCATGEICVMGRDCEDGVCTGGLCAAPTCMDGVANGIETDIDCGGSSACLRCADGRLCPNGPSDCMSPLCTSGRCGDVRGHLVMIGHDYFSTNADADQVIGNTVLLAPESGTIDVLIYDQYADRGATGEVANVEGAITREMTAAGRTARFTRLTDSTMLTTALTSAMDVFIIAEQESGSTAPFPTIATTWEPTLRTFLGAGGVIITTNYFDDGWQLVDRPMLVDIGSMVTASGTLSVLPAAATHPIGIGVNPYTGPNGTRAYGAVMVGGAISITPIISNAAGQVVVYDALF